MITVRTIVRDYLAVCGFDGLCTNECGCGLDDLAPCYNNFIDCDAAYLFRCNDCVKNDCPDRGLTEGYDTFYCSDKDFCKPEYKDGEQE